MRAAFRTLDAFDPTSSLLGVTTLGGVTSVVAAPSGGLISGQGFWFDLLAGPPNTRLPGDMATGAWAMTMHLGGGAGRAAHMGIRNALTLRDLGIWPGAGYPKRPSGSTSRRGPVPTAL